MSAPVYDVRGLEVRLGGNLVLGPLDLQVVAGAFAGILGPNGSGKTTLLRTLTGALRPSSGEVLLENRPLDGYGAADLARRVGVVPQQFTLDFNFTVEEMVAMGRYAHGDRRDRGWGWRQGAAPDAAAPNDAGGAADTDATASAEIPAGREAVAAALRATGMTALAGRLVTELSGGERQRALIAQTLAQQTPILLLDEPLNNLDLNHQLEIMQLLASLHAEGRTILAVLHDLNMAAQYCEELVLLDHGRLAARGAATDILDPRMVLEVFKVRVAVHRHGRRPYLTPVWSGVPGREAAASQTKVHVIGGGGAASGVIEELVARGSTPSVGIVSVFDTDFATAQRYELEVVSAPPFEPFPQETVRELDGLVAAAGSVVVAPVFFGRGNLAPLRTALQAARSGKPVVLMRSPPIEERDLSGGEATALVGQLLAAGALEAATVAEAAQLSTAPQALSS